MNALEQNTKRLPYLDDIKTFTLHTQRRPEVAVPCHNAALFYADRCKPVRCGDRADCCLGC